MKQKIGLIGVATGFFVVLLLVGQGQIASAMESTNYRVEQDSLNFGGNNSSSASYSGSDTLGDIASGEDLTSASYSGCSGFQCYGAGVEYLSFDVRQGTSKPGTAGAGVNLGTADYTSVVSSGISDVRSIYITANANAGGGLIVTVMSDNEGLQRLSDPGQIVTSSSGILTPGDEGYGICVFSADEDVASPTTFDAVTPYSGSCTKSTGHVVGIVDDSSRAILQSSGELVGGDAEILVKAAVSNITDAGDDYQDVLTFIVTATY